MTIADRPLGAIAPEIDADSIWFWDSLKRDELTLPRCNACRLFFFPPIPSCPHCGSADVGRELSQGVGRLYSWATVHIALHPAFAKDVPYVVAVVEVEERARVMGRILDSTPPADGLLMKLTAYRVGESVLPGFVSASSGG